MAIVTGKNYRMHNKIFVSLTSILCAIVYIKKYALSPGIEPRRTAPEADALSIELGEHVYTVYGHIYQKSLLCVKII